MPDRVKDIYDMKLGDIIKVCYWEVMRVAGGWIYSSGNSQSQAAVFVPFNNEFMKEVEDAR